MTKIKDLILSEQLHYLQELKGLYLFASDHPRAEYSADQWANIRMDIVQRIRDIVDELPKK